MHEILDRLKTCSDDQFDSVCNKLAHRVPELAPADAPHLAETVLSLVPKPASPSHGRYWTLIGFLQLFCTLPQCVQALSPELLRRLLSEMHENMVYCAQMRSLDGWGERLHMADCATASLLNSVDRSVASSLLHDQSFGSCEPTDSPLLAECMAKLKDCQVANGRLDCAGGAGSDAGARNPRALVEERGPLWLAPPAPTAAAEDGQPPSSRRQDEPCAAPQSHRKSRRRRSGGNGMGV